jgi:hypothetical protein
LKDGGLKGKSGDASSLIERGGEVPGDFQKWRSNQREAVGPLAVYDLGTLLGIIRPKDVVRAA